MKNLFFSFLIFITFFTVGIFTNNNYGNSWDEPEHFARGYAYFWLFLTGKTTYQDLPRYDLGQAKADKNYHQRSFYQNDSLTADVWFIDDKGHPPLNGILAAFFNYVFYQKLGIVGDVESFHIFNIFISSVLVATVFLFALETFGLWVALFSALFLATYPLFWGESHFNIKDPAETSLFFLTTYFFWKAFHYKKSRFIFISSIFAGLALSVKFNILFLPFILGPWLLAMLIGNWRETLGFVFAKRSFVLFLLFPVVMLTILIITWPYLWEDISGNLIKVLKYYRGIGAPSTDPEIFKPGRLYASSWIIFTTQPLMLASALLGLISLKTNWSKKSFVPLLWFSLFIFPILRVSLPGTNIYGGLRQIMEYLPGFSLIAGLGANLIRKIILKVASFSPVKLNPLIISLICLGVFALVLIYPLYRLHPYENVYFNSLIGGLPGAIEKNFPSAGNSLGNAYKEGVDWLNKNAPFGAKLALIQGTNPNIPLLKPRADIDYSNNHWSGIERKGEYLMELTYNYEFKTYFYAWEYAERVLEPVYEVKADGVPILTIWKNDLEHTRLKYRQEEIISSIHDMKVDTKSITISLPRATNVTRLIVSYQQTPGCLSFNMGHIESSVDGIHFTKEEDKIILNQLDTPEGKAPNTFSYFFAARYLKTIRLVADNLNTCILNSPRIQIFSLNDL